MKHGVPCLLVFHANETAAIKQTSRNNSLLKDTKWYWRLISPTAQIAEVFAPSSGVKEEEISRTEMTMLSCSCSFSSFSCLELAGVGTGVCRARAVEMNYMFKFPAHNTLLESILTYQHKKCTWTVQTLFNCSSCNT